MEKIRSQISICKSLLSTFKSEHTSTIDDTLKSFEDFARLADKISPMWIGAWTPGKTDIYQDFLSGSMNPIKLTYPQIKQYAEKELQSELDPLREILKSLELKVNDFNHSFITELSVIKGVEGLEEQVNLLTKLEEYKFGVEESEIIQHHRPNQLMGGYHQIQKMMTEGLDNPPHIIYGSQVVSPGSKLVSMQEYLKLANRLIREIELKVGSGKEILSIDSISTLDNLVSKFHTVATQLRNRYSNRDTIVINDEYDVQDLFHGLLKIHFDDIRPEEYSPSYAGKNTRIDFLLKDERIMVEVKKTRSDLKDAKIGSELILDIVRLSSPKIG